jgi:hypothetical protein
MNLEFLLTSELLLAEIAGFWILTILCFMVFYGPDVLKTSRIVKRTEQEKERQRAEENIEREKIQDDLNKNVKIAPLQTKKDSSRPIKQDVIDQLLENGVALNHTLTQEDTDNELPGDHWLSANRWLWFAIYQIIVGYPISCIFLLGFTPTTSATVGFLFSVVLGAYYGVLTIPEKMRAGINRWDKFTNFLGSGLQFRVPILETAEAIPLQNMVWGPGAHSDKNSSHMGEYHLEGATGSASNPSPGVINVALHGTYMTGLTVKITLRVKRSRQDAWYRWMFEFANPTEIGEVIADITQAIITTKAREIQEEELNHNLDVSKGNIKVEMDKRLKRFLDEVPEITGKVLLALYEVSLGRLAGIMPISVAITEVTPPVEFTNLLLMLDTARVEREVEEQAGMGRRDRWDALQAERDGRTVDNNLVNLDINQTIAEKGSIVDSVLKPLATQFLTTPPSRKDDGNASKSGK